MWTYTGDALVPLSLVLYTEYCEHTGSPPTLLCNFLGVFHGC